MMSVGKRKKKRRGHGLSSAQPEVINECVQCNGKNGRRHVKRKRCQHLCKRQSELKENEGEADGQRVSVDEKKTVYPLK